MKKEEKKVIQDLAEIPVEGALGLLALGARGLREWRKVRDAARAKEASGHKAKAAEETGKSGGES